MRPSARSRPGTVRLALLSVLSVLAGTAAVPSPVTAQAKSPSTARAIAFFVPGGGHLYAGEPGRGFLLMAAAAGAATVGIATSNYNWDYTCKNSNCMDPNGGPKYSRMYLGLGVAGAIWLYSLYDAAHAVERENRRMTQRVSLLPFARMGAGGVHPGLAVRVRF